MAVRDNNYTAAYTVIAARLHFVTAAQFRITKIVQSRFMFKNYCNRTVSDNNNSGAVANIWGVPVKWLTPSGLYGK